MGDRSFFALKGRERKAQGIAVGDRTEAKTAALKGRDRGAAELPRWGRARHDPRSCRAPSGRAAKGASGAQGEALGFPLPPLQGGTAPGNRATVSSSLEDGRSELYGPTGRARASAAAAQPLAATAMNWSLP